VPGDHERGGRLLARFERERTSQRTGQLLAVRSARLVDAGPGIDREDARRHRVVGEGRDRPHGVATVEHRQGHRPIIVPVLQLEGGRGGPVAEHDVVHADVPPGVGHVVHDFEPGGLPLPGADVERGRLHPVGVAAGRREDDFVVHPQVQAGLALVGPAADQEVDEVPLDPEGLARERARVGVAPGYVLALAGVVGVDQPRPVRTDVPLIGGHLRLAVEGAAVALDDADDQVSAGVAGGGEGLDGWVRDIDGALPVAAEESAALGGARADAGAEIEPARVARDERLGEDDQLRAPRGGLGGEGLDPLQGAVTIEGDGGRLDDGGADDGHRDGLRSARIGGHAWPRICFKTWSASSTCRAGWNCDEKMWRTIPCLSIT
jgi:hypothetical protein